MRFQHVALVLIITTMATLFAGCGALGSAPPSHAISIAFTAGLTPSASMNMGTIANIAATVTNDPKNLGVNWTVTCGSAACGSFNPASTASTEPTQFTAPSSIPSSGTVTVTATSVADNTKSVSASVTITQATLADGTYVFHLGGIYFNTRWDQSNYYVVGAFTVADGAITGGEQDFVDCDAALMDQVFPATSSMTGTADGNLRIVLDTRDPAVGVGGLETLSASLVTTTHALIGEYDTSATSTGTLDLQTSQTAPSGGYAFFATGIDSNADGIAVGGVLNVDGPGSISGAGSVFDLNDAFSQGLEQDQSFSASSVLGPHGSIAPDSFGRVTFTLNPANANIGQIVLIGYVVNTATIQLLEAADVLGGITGGTALSQGADTGTFSRNSLSGSTYVVGTEGVDTNGPLQLAGALTFSSTTNDVSGSATLNDIANQLSGNISAGTYLVDTTGRVTLMGLTGSTFNNATIQLYLDGNGNALSLSMDTSDVTAGYAFQQNPSASLSGSYAIKVDGTAETSGTSTGNMLPSAHRVTPDIAPPASFGPWSAVGRVFIGSGNVTGFTDLNILTESLTPNVQLSGTATGAGEILTGDLTGLDVASSATADSFTYYVIDDLRVFGIETDSTQLSLAYFEEQPPPK